MAKPFSTIKISDQKNLKDNYGFLAKGLLLINEVKNVYKPSSFTDYVNLFLNITNDSNITSEVTIWVSDKTSPERQDLLEVKIRLDPYLTFVRGPVTISNNESVFIKATTDGVVYRLYGYDEREL